jgi:hypothetical protein
VFININTWYVAFRQPNEIPGGYVRNSKTFRTEMDAKQFARERLDEGCDVSTGTINPHRPRKLLRPSQILTWLGSKLTVTRVKRVKNGGQCAPLLFRGQAILMA